MQLVLLIIGVLIFIASVIWLIVDPGFEPLIGFLTVAAALITSFVVDRDKRTTETPSKQIRRIVLIIGIFIFIASAIWLIVEPGFEPLIGLLTAVTTLVGLLITRPSKALERHNRRIMLDHVENHWVKGILEKSLHGEIIKLGILENPDAVPQTWSVRRVSTGDLIDPDLSKLELFKQIGMGRSLLILGEPGSGKTTALLELAREQIACAREDDSEWLPVVVNLSSWASKQKPLDEWLVDEFKDFYRVSKKLTKIWIESDALFLLLDGLDEVRPDCRDACVRAINTFHTRHSGIPLVVCSRSEDYHALNTQLKFQGAVVLQPFTEQQIDIYFKAAGDNLAGVKDLLDKDATLRKMAKTPLMLSVMTLAYTNTTSLPRLETVKAQREHLFNTYIERMFERPGRADFPGAPDKKQTITWLAWLAARMKTHQQTLFLIERLQPTWLETEKQRRLYWIGGRLIVGLREEIITVETLSWSWQEVRRRLLGGLFIGLLAGLLVGLLGWQGVGPFFGLLFGLLGLLLVELLFLLFSGLSGEPGIGKTTAPNQGIRLSLKNALRGGLFVGLLFGLLVELLVGLLVGLYSRLPFGLFVGLLFGLSGGLLVGLLFGMLYGGNTVIQHFILRYILARNNLLPWKLSPFLDYCADRVFLRKVGGGWVFVHRLLLEHFAAMAEPTNT